MQTRHERQARNEALLREVNEQIERVDRTAQEAGLSEDASFEFLCECKVSNPVSPRPNSQQHPNSRH